MQLVAKSMLGCCAAYIYEGTSLDLMPNTAIQTNNFHSAYHGDKHYEDAKAVSKVEIKMDGVSLFILDVAEISARKNKAVFDKLDAIQARDGRDGRFDYRTGDAVIPLANVNAGGWSIPAGYLRVKEVDKKSGIISLDYWGRTYAGQRPNDPYKYQYAYSAGVAAKQFVRIELD